MSHFFLKTVTLAIVINENVLKVYTSILEKNNIKYKLNNDSLIIFTKIALYKLFPAKLLRVKLEKNDNRYKVLIIESNLKYIYVNSVCNNFTIKFNLFSYANIYYRKIWIIILTI
jgi:hypothetical protein